MRRVRRRVFGPTEVVVVMSREKALRTTTTQVERAEAWLNPVKTTTTPVEPLTNRPWRAPSKLLAGHMSEVPPRWLAAHRRSILDSPTHPGGFRPCRATPRSMLRPPDSCPRPATASWRSEWSSCRTRARSRTIGRRSSIRNGTWAPPGSTGSPRPTSRRLRCSPRLPRTSFTPSPAARSWLTMPASICDSLRAS
jgi:hypothetical protein